MRSANVVESYYVENESLLLLSVYKRMYLSYFYILKKKFVLISNIRRRLLITRDIKSY